MVRRSAYLGLPGLTIVDTSVRPSAIAILIMCSMFVLIGCNEPAALSVVTAHKGDQVSWLADSLHTFEIKSSEGIGSAVVRPTDHNWPDSFGVVLELAALEGFVVRSGEERHRLEVTREGRVLLEPSDSRVLYMNHMQAIGKRVRFTLEVNPNNFADTASAVSLEWVDYYR